MPDESALAKANRQMVAERQGLLTELQKYKLARLTLGVHSLALIVDGLEQVEAQASAGDPESRALLIRIDACIRKLPALLAGIVLPNGASRS